MTRKIESETKKLIVLRKYFIHLGSELVSLLFMLLFLSRMSYLFSITKFNATLDNWTDIHHGVFIITNPDYPSGLFTFTEN